MPRPELALVDLGDRDEQCGRRATVANDEVLEVIEQLLLGKRCDGFERCRHDDVCITGFSAVVFVQDRTFAAMHLSQRGARSARRRA